MKFSIVDDDPVLLRLMQSVLEEGGHHVKSYGASLQALREIPVDRPDVVIGDIMMPAMDGFELCREIRGRLDLASIKFIVCSSNSYEFDRRRAGLAPTGVCGAGSGLSAAASGVQSPTVAADFFCDNAGHNRNAVSGGTLCRDYTRAGFSEVTCLR